MGPQIRLQHDEICLATNCEGIELELKGFLWCRYFGLVIYGIANKRERERERSWRLRARVLTRHLPQEGNPGNLEENQQAQHQKQERQRKTYEQLRNPPYALRSH